MGDYKYSLPLKWGIIGCGAVTEVKSGPPYQETSNFQLYGVMRRNIEKAKDYAKRHAIAKVYSKAEDLIFDSEIDAVYIATPPNSHKYYALSVAEAGKPCCIEKPMAPNYSDSLEIYNCFLDKGLPLFIAYYRRSLPRFLKIKEWLDQGKIGGIRQIQWQFCRPPNKIDLKQSYNWRTDEVVAPGGYFDDLASHGLDLFTYLLGEMEEVHGTSINQQRLYSAKDAITACWKHKSGVLGTASWNFGTFNREDKVAILGNSGKIEFSVFNEEDIVLETSEGITRIFIEHPHHVQHYHVDNIRAHLLENKAHPSQGSTGLHTSWIMDRILGNI
ncbi:Gfo/Idh/MocA family protein [Arenibacter certesii]|uniref:Oxidoreductase n=1 Tax=Arenibacter certesii TaxID=228955 RepID=A0A918J455_9FLAO|nr:Gfo/Idh/MocA family oxidoreductase [Arenibacter certesii]GGW46534.1 oxidoreductase [Arenibacter certesii]